VIIGLVDKSGDARITPEVLQKIAAACTFQLADFCPTWDLYASSVQPAQETDTWVENFLYLLANADIAGDLGYHTRDPKGRAYARAFTLGMPLFDPGGILTTVSHEVLEMRLNPLINVWRQDGQGQIWAQEACDACESSTYDEKNTGLPVSDYLRPEWFDPMAKDSFNKTGSIQAPFTLHSNRDYAILENASGQRQIFGNTTLAASKLHPASRTFQLLNTTLRGIAAA
jgi:phage terminase small subunit